MKPIIKYRGGKSKEIPMIEKHIPEFSGRYIEPFFGGGALFFHLEPEKAIINDINSKLIAFYKGVRDNYSVLQEELKAIEELYAKNRAQFESLKKLNPNTRVEDKNEALYYSIRDMFNGLKSKTYSDALIYWFINKTAYSGMIRYNAKGDYNVPFGRYKTINSSLITEAHHNLLLKADIHNEDYSQIFKLAKKDDFIFLDPPYDCIFSDYGNAEHKNGFGEKNHEKLAQDFRKLKCKALLVIGKTPLTESMYRDLIIDEYDKTYAVNIRNRFKSEAKHILVANY